MLSAMSKASAQAKAVEDFEPVEIRLMTRRGCCLCDDAKALLGRLAEEREGAPRPLRIVETDIDADPVLRMRYGDFVPVIIVAGERVAELRMDAEKEARLRAVLGLPGRA